MTVTILSLLLQYYYYDNHDYYDHSFPVGYDAAIRLFCYFGHCVYAENVAHAYTWRRMWAPGLGVGCGAPGLGVGCGAPGLFVEGDDGGFQNGIAGNPTDF